MWTLLMQRQNECNEAGSKPITYRLEFLKCFDKKVPVRHHQHQEYMRGHKDKLNQPRSLHVVRRYLRNTRRKNLLVVACCLRLEA